MLAGLGPGTRPAWLKGRRLSDLRTVRLVRDAVTRGGVTWAAGTAMRVIGQWRGWLMLAGLRHVDPADVEPVTWARASCSYCNGTGEAFDPTTGEGPVCPACEP